jgi:hypothetical protein
MNLNCDGGRCKLDDGEVRMLPLGKRARAFGYGNAILCEDCFYHEIQWRKERNRELAPHAQYELPRWADLEIYT